MASLRIGDLARLGGVSVRMLRHYHDIGLLVPAFVDPATSYRGYEFEQLETLRHIVRLKGFGLTLDEVARAVHGGLSVGETRTLLAGRRAAVEMELASGRAQLARIDAYLESLRSEQTMSTPTITVDVRALPAQLVAQASAVAESFAPDDIGPVIMGLYPRLIGAMQQAGLPLDGPTMAWYEDADDERIIVHATMALSAMPETTPAGIEVVELPAIARAATTLHHGPMDTCDVTYQALLRWIADNGCRPVGYSRELDVVCPADGPQVTELQLAIEPA